VLAALVNVNHLVETSGYPILFVLVAAESCGVPLPGETSLIAGALLASRGKLQIEIVIAVAAAAAAVGGAVGYEIGRWGGERLLERPGPFLRDRRRVLAIGKPFFARHGPKVVFISRFVVGLRTWAAWLAGAGDMRRGAYLAWNALAAVCWATAVGLIAYFVGRSAGTVIARFGLYGLAAVAVVLAGGVALYFRRRRRRAAAGRGGGGDG